MTAWSDGVAARGAAACVGVAIPFLVSGRATMGVAASLGVLMILIDPGRGDRFTTLAACLRSRLGIAACLVFLSWLPSVAFSLDLTRSGSVWLRMVGIVAGSVWIWDLLRRNRRLLSVCQKAFVACAVSTAIVAVVGLLAWSPLIAAIHGDGFVAIDAGRRLKSYASAVGCLLPLVIWSGVVLDGRWKWLALIYPLLVAVIIFGTHSAAGLLAVLAAAMAVISWWCWRRRQLSFLYLSAAVLACIAYSFLVSQPVIPLDRFTNPPPNLGLPEWLIDLHRQAIWRFSASVVMDAPWFGHGINTSNFVVGADTPIPEVGSTIMPSHPHNWILEVLIDTGFVGTATVSATLVILLVTVVRTVENRAVPATLALFAAFWVSSLVNFSIWSAWWQCTFAILLAIVAASGRNPQDSAGEVSHT